MEGWYIYCGLMVIFIVTMTIYLNHREKKETAQEN
jgi:hypothetical protein